MEYCNNARLMCSWAKWEVMSLTQLAVHVKPGNCTDMTGAIRIGKYLMPQVKSIAVFSGDALNIVYRVDHDKRWWAYDADGKRGRGFVV